MLTYSIKRYVQIDEIKYILYLYIYIYIYTLDKSCYIGNIMQPYLVYNDIRSNWFNIIISMYIYIYIHANTLYIIDIEC